MSCPVRPLSSVRFGRTKLSLLVLTLAALLPAAGRAQTFSNSGTISIPDGSGSNVPASGQYPTSGACSNSACVAVSGLTGSYTSMAVNLNFSSINTQSFPSAGFLLESPGGQFLDMLSFACADSASSASITLTDTASSLFPSHTVNCTISSGSYKPAHYDAGAADVFPSPGPGGSGYNIAGDGTNTTGTATLQSTFCSNPATCVSGLNGTWKLFAVDQGGLASPTQFTWSLTFSVTGANAATTTVLAAGNPNPSFSSGSGSTTTFTATVTSSGNPVTSGSVTLFNNTTSTNLSTVALNGSGHASFPVVLSTQGTNQLYAVYNGATGFASSTSSFVNQTVVNHATQSVNGSVTSFCNSGPVALSSNAAGRPYPAMIVLGDSGITTEPTLSGTIESVSVSLNGISLSNGEDLDFLGFALQGPGATTTKFSSSGNTFEFLSWAGNPYTSGSLTLSDTGSGEIPPFSAPSCTNCLPTDDWADIGSNNSDSFPSPAPSSVDKAPPTGSASFATEFGGGGVSGTWSLWVDNRLTTAGSPGSIGSWCLNFVTQLNAHATTTAVTSSANPATFVPSGHTGTASVGFTATVTSDQTVNAGTVTFVDGTTTLGTANVVNGVATLGSVALSEGTHQIIASYGGTNTGTEFGISNAKYDERVNAVTTNPTSASGAGPYSYCNTAAITAPGLTFDAGAAYPYPSNIFVTNLPGTVKATTLTLNQFSTKDQGDLMSLLVGPSTNGNQWNNHLDFFSLTGTNVSSPGISNLVFDDTGASIGSTNLESSGTFAPESNETLTFPQCPPNASDCGTQNVGPPLGTTSNFTPTHLASPKGTDRLGNAGAAGIFGGTTSSTYNGNGTWSLYLDDGGPLGGGEATNLNSGWCVNLTINQPVVAPTNTHSGIGIGGNFVQGEQTGASITVNIENNGPGSTGDPSGTSPMTVTDVLDSHLSYVAGSSSGSGWQACTSVVNTSITTVTCKNDASIADGGSYQPLTFNVAVAANAPASVTNHVTASGAGAALATSSNDTINIDPAPVLAVAVSHPGAPATFTQGSTAEWDVQVSNTASGGRTNGTMTVTDVLPSKYTLSGSSSTGGTWSCGGSTIGLITTVTCTSTSQINGGSSSTIALTVNVPADSPVHVTDSASAFGGGDLTHISLGTAATSTADSVTVIQVPASVVISGSSTQSATILTAYASPLVVTVEDAGGVAIANYSANGGVSYSADTSNPPSGTFTGGVHIIASNADSNGQVSETITANNKVGSFTVTVTAGSAQNTYTLTNTVGAPASINVVSGSGQSATVLTAFGSPMVAQVLDAGSNPVPGVTVTFTPPSSGSSLTFAGPNTAITDASGDATSAAMTANSHAGAYQVTASASSLQTQFSMTNNPGPATQLIIPGGPEPFDTGFGFTITAEDASGNVATSYNGTVALTSSDPNFVNLGPFTLVNGTVTASAALKTAGTDSITATDTVNSAITGTGFFIIQPGPANHFGIATPSSATVGSPISFTVTAYDLASNVATSYTGTAAFTSSDPSAILPANYTFVAGDNGAHTFQATMVTPGAVQTITATDSANSIAMTSNSINVTIPNLVVNTNIDDAGTASNCTVQATPGTNSGDSSCSLRDALLESATLGSANITFDSTAFASPTTITLASTLTVPQYTTIQGPTSGKGATLTNLVTVDGGGPSVAAPVFTTVSHSTGIVLQNLIITDGDGGTAGGIFNGFQTSMTLQNCTVSANTSAGGTGGIFNDFNAILTVMGSTISGNSGTVGGISSEAGAGSITVINSTLAGNSSSSSGGAINNAGNSITISDSTISGNSALFAGGGLNTASGTTTLANTIVAGNSAGSNPDVNGGDTDNGGNQIGTAVHLSALGSFGGPTQTMVPLPSSAAICGGLQASIASGVTTDQRGLPNTNATYPGYSAGSPCVDAGAVQTNYAIAIAQQPSTSSTTANLVVSVPISPAPAASVTESGNPVNGATVTIADADSALSGTTTQTSDAGTATFNGLSISSPQTGDTLTFTLPLNASLNMPVTSYPFNAVYVAPVLIWPAPGTTLKASTETFRWSAAGPPTSYLLKVSTLHFGGTDVFGGNTSATSILVPTIPTNGAPLFVQLSYKLNGAWVAIDYSYTEKGTPTPPAMITPAPSSTITGSSATFTWSAGAGPTAYILKVGTTNARASDVFIGSTTSTSLPVPTGIPTNGGVLYVTLEYQLGATWTSIDYTYMESGGGPNPPTMVNPAPGSTLTGSSVTFNWSAGTGDTEYRLRVGTTGVGSSDIYLGNPTPALSAPVSGLPINGQPVYVTLGYKVGGVWHAVPYTYTAQ